MKARDQKWFDEGMAFALRIANKGGIDELRKECEFRAVHEIEPNYTPDLAHALARAFLPKEIEVVTTASAYTITETLKLPPSMMYDFLNGLAKKADEYRYNPEKLKEDSIKLNMNKGFLDVTTKYNEDLRKACEE